MEHYSESAASGSFRATSLSHELMRLRAPLLLTLGYLLASLLWIALSDRALGALVDNADEMVLMQSAKGAAFVLLSALAIFAALRGGLHGRARAIASEFRRVALALLHAERACNEADTRYRCLVEQSIAGIFILQDGVLAYVNPRFAQMLGYRDAAGIVGRDALSFIARADRGRAENALRALGESRRRNCIDEFDAVRTDGSTIRIGVHINRASQAGRPALIGLVQDISETKRAEEQVQRYIRELEGAFMRTVEVATTLSEMRDPHTAGHERRVAGIAVAIGAKLGFDARRQEGLRVAGYLHDVGKIAIPAEILSKPGPLSRAEFDLVKSHAQSGYDILKCVEFPWPVAQVALQHHERLDGTGYPNGLRGDTILLEARILAVADAVEAMASHRPYRPALGIDQALAEIEQGRGKVYDPAVADACLTLFRQKGYAIPTES